jgi:hypothetical protein
VALGSGLWAVTAGGLSWLLCMEACCCAEQQRQQAEDRRDSMQCFLHLIPLDVSMCEVDALFGNFSFLFEDGRVIVLCIRYHLQERRESYGNDKSAYRVSDFPYGRAV